MQRSRVRGGAEAGFTLVEALIAIVILVFGLMAVANLFAIATTSNTVANQSSAATAAATERMEQLKALDWASLTEGGNLDSDSCTTPDEPCQTFCCLKTMAGVGIIRTRWRVSAVGDDGQIFFFQVRSEGTGAVSGARTRAEFTAFRTCTAVALGCNDENPSPAPSASP